MSRSMILLWLTRRGIQLRLSGWKLGDYYDKNQFIPSRHKLYTIVDLSEVYDCIMINIVYNYR